MKWERTEQRLQDLEERDAFAERVRRGRTKDPDSQRPGAVKKVHWSSTSHQSPGRPLDPI